MIVVVAVVLPAQAGASVAHCAPVRINQADHPSAAGKFGAFDIAATGTSCTPARAIAGAYAEDPYAVDSPKPKTTHLNGWSCRWRQTNPDIAQEVTVTCTKATAKVVFVDKLASG
jgi:hypothetical protein